MRASHGHDHPLPATDPSRPVPGTFLGVPSVPPHTEALKGAAATYALYGIPIDGTTLLRTGSMYGPRAIRDASSWLVPYHTDHDLDLTDHLTLVDCGDVEVVPGNAARTFANARADLAQIHAAGAMPIVLGGEHSVTIPATWALADAVSRGHLGLVNLDSHFDTSVDVLGERLTHCSPITRALDTGRYRARNTVIVGVHGCGNPRAEWDYARERGITVFTVRDIEERGVEAVMRETMEIAWNDAAGVYVTVDIDCLDGAFAPGTCSPEPGGMTARELVAALRVVGRHGFSAFDVAEVAPQYDPGGITARTAARVVLDLLAARVAAASDGDSRRAPRAAED